ncbi:hypothetical protein [Schaalia cardiffensis]|uniref:hypothetical protein n=1 Tax=Schaalia cardiffensis TaxID=181487 RepID=UPI0023F4D855|nr:hypothetical protein [Schaalia cardiffensis]
MNLRGMYSVSDVPVQAAPVPDSVPVVQGPVFSVGDGIEVGVSSADEWNRALEECLAHAANGPILLQQCRIILGLEHPESGESPDSDPATSTAPSVETLTPRQIVSYAHAQHTINGAGLAWQPKTNAFVGLPTLVHVTSPTQNATLSLFGQAITIALEASHFSYDFGDGSPTLETEDPSAPYPVQTLSHVYTQTSPGRIITLTTTWNATITYPSGRSVYLANALTSTESSTPITILRATINIIPTNK